MRQFLTARWDNLRWLASKLAQFARWSWQYLRWLTYPVNPGLLYETRHIFFPWALMLGLSAGMAYGVARYLEITNTEDIKEFLQKGGTWLVAVLAAPIAWYVWLIRDRNRLAEFTNTRLAELRQHFYNLQEWATDNSNPSRQSTALFQLRDFLREEPGMMPKELAEDSKRFARMAQEFFQMLLKNRALWDQPNTIDITEESAQGEQRNPVKATLEEILTTDGFRLTDLRKAQLAEFNLTGAHLGSINLSNANLRLADLYGVNLQGAILVGARLDDAALRFAKLDNAVLNFAVLNGADLLNANLGNVQHFGAHLKNAKLNLFWRNKLTGYEGIPIWIDAKRASSATDSEDSN